MIDYLKNLRQYYEICDYLNTTRGSLGKWEISDNIITCNVQQDMLYKKFDNHFSYYLYLIGKNDDIKEKKELNKNFKYVFEDITFDKTVKLKASNTTVIFRNCVFTKGIYFDESDTVIFENNIYDNICDRDINDSTYIRGEAKNVQFINDNFFAIDYEEAKNFIFKIRAKNIYISETRFDSPLMNLQLNADSLKILDSYIDVYNIMFKSDSFYGSNSKAKVARKFDFSSKKQYLDNFVFDGSIIEWNGIKMVGNNRDNKVIKEKKVGDR